MVNFVSISGGAGSGKSTVTKHLRQRFFECWYECRDFSFAGPMKDALCLWFGWDRHRLDHDYGYKEGAVLDDGAPDPYCQALGRTRREIMQTFGTECLRRGMCQDFWIILADLGLQLNKIPPSDIYVISDARMTNELEWVRSLNGYEILLHRVECPRGADPDKVKYGATLTHAVGHRSEQEFLSWKDYDESIVNLVDHNQTQIANLNALTEHLDKVTIPAIRKRFSMTGKGRHNPELYR
jgi:hypothetical protein